ncbi:MAG: M48 family metallopeptidase [Candidatus Hadarchaeum sp.]|uniref:M48 family metallopeptidase n=1 Tax=Candidatus Hadarchaeum sp. TaxID=2883567 RepID=UPI003D139CC6
MARSLRGLEKSKSIWVNGTDLPYRVARRRVRYPRLEFKTGELLVILPEGWKDEASLLERKIGWISRKHGEIKGAVERFKSLMGNGHGLLIFGNFLPVDDGKVRVSLNENSFECDLNDRRQLRRLRDALRERLRQELETAAVEYSKKFGVEFNRIFIRRQKTKWASCSSRGDLSFNFLLACLPRELIRYVVCHEILHLREKRHNKNFWEEVGREFENFEEMEKRLFEYWFLIQEYSRSVDLFAWLILFSRPDFPC